MCCIYSHPVPSLKINVVGDLFPYIICCLCQTCYTNPKHFWDQKEMVLFRLLGLSLFIFFCCASAAKQTVLAKEVCKKTSNYTFCVESLYADPRTPKANRQTLAYITFGLAYLNASKTQKLIAELLESQLLQFLKRCKNDYDKAVSKLEGAYNDLNSETYFELANDANEASGYAKDCEAAINGRRSSLTPRNRHLKGLCEICVVVAKLFTGK
ncbi:putative invertase inhibitor [Ziziphus jujuba]|uniref:Invertase inhibitor n=1 Tax=Ziziphus jujuba TaxID=326968 RepID=A0A6P4BDF2_ZIZJJ|nr:putative invertase inhibitor [Ziziphus jujuba]